MDEKRKNKRLDLEVSVEMERLDQDENITKMKFIHVDVINISRSGLGFFSGVELAPNTFYNAKIQIWTKEIVNAVLKIARCVPEEDGFSCGGVFIGLAEADALKIDIYEMYNEQETE